VKIVTAKELGEFLKLTESTIYKLASTGELPGFKIGDSWRFDMDEILEQIRRLKRPIRRGSLSLEKTH
jgi:excisionase family DNA binding protein